MINQLRERNAKLINDYKENQEKLNTQLLIKSLLSNDNCFFEIEMELAFAILRDLNIPEENLNSIYLALIHSNNFQADN